MILFYSGHLPHEHERPDMVRKHVNTDKAQWKDPELTTLWSETGGGGINMQSKQAHVLRYKS